MPKPMIPSSKRIWKAQSEVKNKNKNKYEHPTPERPDSSSGSGSGCDSDSHSVAVSVSDSVSVLLGIVSDTWCVQQLGQQRRPGQGVAHSSVKCNLLNASTAVASYPCSVCLLLHKFYYCQRMKQLSLSSLYIIGKKTRWNWSSSNNNN